jgi:hypothetical protein
MDREDSWAALLQTMSDERVIAWAELTDEQLDKVAAEFTEDLPVDDPMITAVRDRLRRLRDLARDARNRQYVRIAREGSWFAPVVRLKQSGRYAFLLTWKRDKHGKWHGHVARRVARPRAGSVVGRGRVDAGRRPRASQRSGLPAGAAPVRRRLSPLTPGRREAVFGDRPTATSLLQTTGSHSPPIPEHEHDIHDQPTPG